MCQLSLTPATSTNKLKRNPLLQKRQFKNSDGNLYGDSNEIHLVNSETQLNMKIKEVSEGLKTSEL